MRNWRGITLGSGLLLAMAALGVQAASPEPATRSAATSPAKEVAVEIYGGYFVNNNFEPAAKTSLVVVREQAGFDRAFGVAMVMGDRSHRLAQGVFDKSLVAAAIHRGPYTSYSEVSASLQDGVLTLKYTAKAEAGNGATFNSPLIVSMAKEGVKKVVFVENGEKVGEKTVEDGVVIGE